MNSHGHLVEMQGRRAGTSHGVFLWEGCIILQYVAPRVVVLFTQMAVNIIWLVLQNEHWMFSHITRITIQHSGHVMETTYM